MGELSNYSIETDQLIWLSFKSGQNLRVTVGQLPHYLSPHDLKQVRRAIKLRRDFFRHHMPKTLAVLAALGLTALAVTSGQVLATMWQQHHSQPEPAGRTELVRNALPESAAPAPAPTGTPVAVSTVLTPVARTGRTAAQAKRIPAPSPAARKLTAPAVAITPLSDVSGEKPVNNPQPTPTPSPVPSNPVAQAPVVDPSSGQVLGDSTSPGAVLPTPVPPAP